MEAALLDDGPLLDERRARVLKGIVEEYVRSAQPVGSATVLRRQRLSVSPATVRNDMAYLEAEGFVLQPHTSAGRIPSDLGYRYFVDHWVRPRGLAKRTQASVEAVLGRTRGSLEGTLDAATQVLVETTGMAAVVLAPSLNRSTLVSVHLTLLAPRRIMAVLVTRSGRVANLVIDTAEDLPEDKVHDAGHVLRETLVGRSDWLTRPRQPAHCEDAEVAGISRLVCDEIGRLAADEADLHLGGVSSLADCFGELEIVHGLLDVLERRPAVIGLLEGLLHDTDRSIGVGIGSELPVAELQSAAVVLSPYRLGSATGILAVVGPTRMDYSQTMSTVGFVSGRLEHGFMATD